jgi:hypothetical protein
MEVENDSEEPTTSTGTTVKLKTRAQSACPIFGAPASISENMLPDHTAVMRDYQSVRQMLQKDGRSKEPNIHEIIEHVAAHVQSVWLKASIPVLSHQRILEKLRNYHDRYRNLLKPYKKRCKDPGYVDKLNMFRSEAKVLFDIAACKCRDFSACGCDGAQRVPPVEREFLTDQRSERKMMIGGVDAILTKKKVKLTKRKKNAEQFKKRSKLDMLSDTSAHVIDDESSDPTDVDADDSNDSDFGSDCPLLPTSSTSVCDQPETSVNSVGGFSQMRTSLPKLARECDRWGVSDRSAAAIASAVLQDVGLISQDDSALVIDRSKIRRERMQNRSTLQLHALHENVVRGLYFDGRKDKTRHNTLTDGKYHPSTGVEEHIVLIKEPGSEYLGHVTPTSGTSLNLFQSIDTFLSKNSISTEQLVAIGCDGTNVNTGHQGGVIRRFEVTYNKPLHWFVCLLHMNELPLRHLLIHLDGVTQGPNSFSGPIGKSLKSCSSPVVQFQPIQGHVLPDVDANDLSDDQKYLYEMSKAVMSGQCSPDLAERKPGPMAHARWLTTASRTLRLYVGQDQPSDNLCILVTYIVKVYTPVWFAVKSKPFCTDGPRHLWKLISNSRYLPDAIRSYIDPVIQRNAFFAHPENILLAMMSDDRPHIRGLGCRRVLAARALKMDQNTDSDEIRVFKVPSLIFDAQEYYEIIDWQSEQRSEPPLTRNIDEGLLRSCAENPLSAPAINFPYFPCHTQAVERGVRLVTEACEAVVGEDKRDGFIWSRIASRSVMPHFETKSDYRLQ